MRRPDNPQAPDRSHRPSPEQSYDAVVAAYIHEISSRHGDAEASPAGAGEE